jgi:hypothetical protein
LRFNLIGDYKTMAYENNQISWLLGPEDPLIRYNTLVYLLDRTVNDPDVIKVQELMINSPPISNIFRNQNPDGGFLRQLNVEKRGAMAKFGYVPKYKSSLWDILFLAQANVPSQDPHIQALCNYILKNAYNKDLGFFGVFLEKTNGLRIDMMPCLNSRMIWALCKFGFGNCSEVRRSFEFLVNHQRFDDGDFNGTGEWPYIRNYQPGRYCWGTMSCFAGIIEFLRAVSIVPDNYWTTKTNQVKQKLIDYMLHHRLIYRTLKSGAKGYSGKNEYRLGETEYLLSFSSPNILPDAIDIVTSLLQMGIKNPVIDDAIDSILAKKNRNDRWIADRIPNNMYGRWGKKDEENKWITFRALRVLKLAGKFSI